MIESNRLKQQIRVLFKIFFFYKYHRSGFCNLICCKTGLNVGGIKNAPHHFPTRSAAMLQNSSYTFVVVVVVVVTHFNVALTQFQIKPRWRKSRAPQSDSNPRPLR